MDKIITVDCDDVLSETIDALLEYYNYNIKGKLLQRKDVTFHEFDQIKKYHYTFDERVDRDMDFFLHKDALHKIKKVDWAIEKIKEFKSKWYKIYVVTWRWDRLKEHTKEWLKLNYGDLFDWLCLTNWDSPDHIHKSEICSKLWSQLMVEDNIIIARDIASKWIKVYLLDKPWNQDYNDDDKNMGIIKIYDWSEINI